MTFMLLACNLTRGFKVTSSLHLPAFEATISMVEGNRGTFQISDAELASRRRFVAESRQTLEQLQKDLLKVRRLLAS